MAKLSTKPPKGTRDFLGPELTRRRQVVEGVERIYRAHGFTPLETPSFERLQTLLGKYGEEGDQLVFKVLHRGQKLVDGVREAASHIADESNIIRGRSGETAPDAETMLADMGLRYDLTVPLARVVAEYRGKLPRVYRRFQVQPVWRADNPGKGRFREFYQCDFDVSGSYETMVADAEVVTVCVEILSDLPIGDIKIKLNDRRLLDAIFETCGCPPD